MKNKQQLALDKAYKEAGHNAYFGNGFNAGVEWARSNQWIDILNEMPKMGQEVILYSRTGVIIGINHEGNFYDFEMSEFNAVTHWMPIPNKL